MGTSSARIQPGQKATLTLIKGPAAIDPADPDGPGGSNPPPFEVLGVEPTFQATFHSLLEDGGVVVFESGKFHAFGTEHALSWTTLHTKGSALDQTITVTAGQADVGSWAGKEIVIASTDFDQDQAKVLTVGSVTQPGSQAVIDFTGTDALEHDHYGMTYAPAGKAGNPLWEVEERAEVGLLTRNVLIRAETGTWNAGTAQWTWAPGSGEHGHVILCRDLLPTAGPQPIGRFSWAQFLNLGVKGKLMRYPLHFHKTGDFLLNLTNPSFIKDCSFQQCYNKFLAVHETQNITVSGNVGYQTIGNGYYLEDKEAKQIALQGNLGLGIKAITAAEEHLLEPTGLPDREPAVFWMVSADNKVSGNSAAGSEYYGFWYSPMKDDPFTVDVNGGTSFFKENVAHSNGHHGFYQDKFVDDPLTPRAQPWYTTQPQMLNCTSYKNRRYGFWVRSYGRVILEGLKAADNRSGFYFASDGFQKVIPDTVTGALRSLSRITLTNSLAIGETDQNLNGNLGYVDPLHLHEYEAQRSLPQPLINLDGDRPHNLPWAFLTGIDLYDGLIELENVRFADFHDRLWLDFPSGGGQGHRIGAAISQVAYDSQYMIDPRNRTTNIEFASVDRRVAFRYPSLQVSGANMIKNTIVFDVDNKLTTNPPRGIGYLMPGNQEFLTYLVPGVSLLTLDQALHVPVASADYASLVIETPGASPIIFWTTLTHSYPTAGPAQKVREANGEDRFPLAVLMNREYTLDYLDNLEQPILVQMDRPAVVDLSLRFAEQEDQSIIIAVPWRSTTKPATLTVNTTTSMVEKFSLTDLRSPGNLDNSYYWDGPASTVYVRIYSKLKPGSVDLISTGTEQLCHIAQQ